MATDFARLDAMKDEDIDCSDIPAMTEEELRSAEGVWTDATTEIAFLSIRRELMDYFKQGGKGYMMRISRVVNNLLGDYVAQQKLAQEAI